MTIRCGHYDKTESHVHTVLEYKIHPGYSNLNNDIALLHVHTLEISTDETIDSIAPDEVPIYNGGEPFLTAGWGSTSSEYYLSNILINVC